MHEAAAEAAVDVELSLPVAVPVLHEKDVLRIRDKRSKICDTIGIVTAVLAPRTVGGGAGGALKPRPALKEPGSVKPAEPIPEHHCRVDCPIPAWNRRRHIHEALHGHVARSTYEHRTGPLPA